MTWKQRLALAAAFVVGCAAATATFGGDAPESDSTSEPRPATSLDEYHSATCRVVATDASGGFGVGTGTHIGVVYPKNGAPESVILTNAHVVESGKTFACQFFGDGRPNTFDAKLAKKRFDSSRQYDFAFLTIPRSELSELDPPFVRLPPSDRAETTKTAPFVSCGCPEAREPMLFKGRRVGEFGRVETFKPAPLQGQSGSTVVQLAPDGGLEARAIVSYRTSPTSTDYDFDRCEGGAIPLKYLYESESGRAGEFSTPTPSGLTPLSSPVSAPFSRRRLEEAFARFSAESSAKPPVEAKTKPLLLYFSASWCSYCKTTTPIVDELSKRFATRTVDVDVPDGRRAWRSYGFSAVPAFAFIAVDSQDRWERTLDVWTGAENCRDRIVDCFNRIRPTYPRPSPRPVVARFGADGEPNDDAASTPEGDERADASRTVDQIERAVDASERPDSIERLLRTYERGLTPWNAGNAGNADRTTPTPAPAPTDSAGLFGDRSTEFLDQIETDVRARLDRIETDFKATIDAQTTAVVDDVKAKIDARLSETIERIETDASNALTSVANAALSRTTELVWSFVRRVLGWSLVAALAFVALAVVGRLVATRLNITWKGKK